MHQQVGSKKRMRSLRGMVIIGSLLAAVVVVAVVVVVMRQTNNLLSALDQRVEYDEQLVDRFSTIYASGLQMGQATRNIILNPSDSKAAANHAAAMGEVMSAITSVERLLEKYDASADSTKNKIRKGRSLIEEDGRLQQQAQEWAMKKKIQEAITLINTQETQRWREAKKIVQEMLTAQKASMAAELSVVQEDSVRVRAVIIGAVILCLIMVSLTPFLLLRFVLEPMNHVTIALSHADINTSLHAGRTNEIGDLERAFDTFVSSIRTTLTQVAESSAAVASASLEISSSTEVLASGSQEQSSQAGDVAAAVSQMTQTLGETNQNIRRVAEGAKDAKESARKSGEVVGETIKGMQRIAEVVNQSASQVKILGASSDKIGEIIGVIDDIADQTNLLALNAAIEAARAGEQGRGFAVVADEVRKLAERTSKATKEIASMIRQIQSDTNQAVSSMEKGTQEVGNGIVLAGQAGTMLNDIVGNAQTVADMVEQIAAASEQQSSASQQISRNVEAISTVTQESASGTQQIARTAEDLSRLTEELQNILSKFNLVMASREQGASKLTVGTERGHSRKAVSAAGQLIERT